MKYGAFIGGLVVGVAATAITMLSSGWMVSSSLAESMQEKAAHRAVKDELASICVAQFKSEATNKDAMLKQMKTKSDVQRRDFVEEHGWSRMPGDTRSDAYVAGECADRILEQTG